MTIKDTNIVRTEKPRLSEIFSLPEGLDSDIIVVPLEDKSEPDPIDSEAGSSELPPPMDIVVKQEVVVERPDKSHVVTLILGFADVDGAISYEAKITKL